MRRACDYPLVCNACSSFSEDGRTLLVEGATVDKGAVPFAIALDELQNFVAFLLVSAGTMTALRERQGEATEATGVGSRPIPVTSISVGEPDGEAAYLGIGVGPAKLVFAIPTAALAPVGRAMLTASAPTGREHMT